MSIINFELEEISKICKNVVPNSKIIACTHCLVRVEINQTESRQIIVCLRFPDNYPDHHILIELKSRKLSQKFLDKLTNLTEIKAREHAGKPQIIQVLKFIDQYLKENPLCVVFEEILSLKQLLNNSQADLKLKQKTSSLSLTARGGNYYFKIKVEVPENYPQSCIVWKEFESNLPEVLIRYLNGQAKEIARQCVEPPLRQVKHKNADTFTPNPSLLKALKFVIEATQGFSKEKCPICENLVIAEDPKNAPTDELDPLFVERVYCGHLFHQGCLKKYMQNPPFPAGGKLCPAPNRHPRPDNPGKPGKNEATCGIRLAHDRWVVNVKVAEARWAQKQARERELEEVVDFLL